MWKIVKLLKFSDSKVYSVVVIYGANYNINISIILTTLSSPNHHCHSGYINWVL